MYRHIFRNIKFSDIIDVYYIKAVLVLIKIVSGWTSTDQKMLIDLN